jgi:hypothetical protein
VTIQRAKEQRGLGTISTNMKIYGSILESSKGIVTYVKGISGFLKVLQSP